jgi:hypothetical protein
MTCEELQNSISAYVDDDLTDHARRTCDEHLVSCPLCRSALIETRTLARSLSALSRPAPPLGLSHAISNRLHTEQIVLTQPGGQRSAASRFSPARILDWCTPRAMPFGVGAFASVLLFVLVIGGLLPTMRRLHVLEQVSLLDDGIYYSTASGYDVTQPITAEDYVASRTPFTAFSPSLDPRGALALASPTQSLDMEDEDDMIVVADVYSNGEASVAEVMNAPRDTRMLNNLEAALRRTPAFVPARLDNRPATMRVVFMVQHLNVPDRSF